MGLIDIHSYIDEKQAIFKDVLKRKKIGKGRKNLYVHKNREKI